MPLNLYDLNSEYGTETELRNCVKAFRDKDMGVYSTLYSSYHTNVLKFEEQRRNI